MAVTSSDLIKKIRRIQIQTTHLANDILAGAYRSAFKGKGMEFEEVREYQPGDDVRSIDWNVTARMNHPYVKNFREERELSVTLVVDVSSSTRFGSGNELKNELIAEVAAVIAFSAIKNNDKTALILFTDRVEKYLPPKKGTRHVLRVIRELLTHTPEHQGTNIGNALSFLGKVQQRAGVCFLISDFICPDFTHEASIISRRHDLVPIAIVDPADSRLPEMNLVSFHDLESRTTRLIDTSSRVVRESLQSTTQNRLASQKSEMLKLGTEICTINTDAPYIPQLRKYFALRQKRFR
jgi:Uncharacterized conserved protein (some members contain a von Willebrand factor type A (vWA) domain)